MRVEHFDDLADLDVEPGFLAHLPREARFERFTEFKGAARQAPAAGQWLEPALHQDDATTLVYDDGAHADDGTLRILARVDPGLAHGSPMTFTTTRLRRWPSNSA
jgi:hypothetical protein